MRLSTIIGLPFTLIGGFGLYQYFTEGDPFNFAGNCNPYATASRCDDISIGYLVIGLVFGFIGLAFMGLASFGRRAMANEQKFLQTARPGIARIVSVDQPMNVQVNNQPMLTFVLEITPDGMSSYQHTMRSTVSALVMSQVKLTPGSELPVRIDPNDPTNIRIGWSIAAAHQAQQQPAATSSV